ncbi:MAG: serine/threonine-protein kinase [Planctomycetaceae bacterium]
MSARRVHLAARLHHPNIVPVFETGDDNRQLFIVSEFCAGTTLGQWIKRQPGPVDPKVSARIVRQLADAADHAHRQGLIHRDIKPENVLLDESDAGPSDLPFVLALTDFGLARDLAAAVSSTRTGMVLGTAEYMSPEQATARREQLGPATDVYSLGVLLYQLLSGHLPFSGPSEFEVIQQIVRAEPVAPSREVPGIPRDLNSICLKCLERIRIKRYADGAALRSDLEEVSFEMSRRQQDRLLRKPSLSLGRRAPAIAALVSLISITGIGVLAGMSYHLRQAEQHSRELETALQTVREERETARSAENDADVARVVAEQERETARTIGYRADLRLAFQLWEQGRFYQVREILNRQQPGSNRDLRGAEWFVLNTELNAKHQVLGHHQGGATECVCSLDRQAAYTAGIDGVIRVWDLTNGVETRQIHPGIGEIHAMALSPDERFLAIGGRTRVEDDRAHVMLIDTVTGERHGPVQTHETTVEYLAYSPDGRWLAGGSRYQPVQLTRLEDGQTFPLVSDRRHRMFGFSSDSRLFAMVAGTEVVSIWQVDQNEPIEDRRVPGFRGGSPYLVCFTPGDSLLATAYTNRDYLTLFDEPNHQQHWLAQTDRQHSASADFCCLGFSADNRWFAAGDESGRVLIWERQTPTQDPKQELIPVAAMNAHQSRVTSLQITDGPRVISSGDDGRICLTSPFSTGASHVRWNDMTVQAACIDGGELLLGCSDGTVRHRPLPSLDEFIGSPDDQMRGAPKIEEPPALLLQTTSGIRSIDVSTHGDMLAVGTEQGDVALYDRNSGQCIKQFATNVPDVDPMEVSVYAVALSNDGQSLACTGRSGEVMLYNTSTGEVRWTYFVGNGFSLLFLQDDTLLVCGNNQEQLVALEVSSGRLVGSVDASQSYALARNMAGDSLAVALGNGRIQLIDALLVEMRSSLTRHISASSLAFANEDRSLVSLDGQGDLYFATGDARTEFGKLRLPHPSANYFKELQILSNEEILLAITSTSTDEPKSPPASDLYVWSIRSQPNDVTGHFQR